MKKPVTFRIEQNLLEQARRSAQAENRTLTNFVETLIKTKVTSSACDDATPIKIDRKLRGTEQ